MVNGAIVLLRWFSKLEKKKRRIMENEVHRVSSKTMQYFDLNSEILSVNWYWSGKTSLSIHNQKGTNLYFKVIFQCICTASVPPSIHVIQIIMLTPSNNIYYIHQKATTWLLEQTIDRKLLQGNLWRNSRKFIPKYEWHLVEPE